MEPSTGPDKPMPTAMNPVVIIDPLAVAASCCSSSDIIVVPPPAVLASPLPCQVPVTSTVTSVRSIQSERTQPTPHISATAVIIRTTVFIEISLLPLPRVWRYRPRRRIDNTTQLQRAPRIQRRGMCVPVHIVPSYGQPTSACVPVSAHPRTAPLTCDPSCSRVN